MRRLHPKWGWAICLSIVATLAAAAGAIPRVGVKTPSPVRRMDIARVNPPRGPVQIISFTLYDAGIYPREVRARSGLVTVSIEDLSGTSSGLIVEHVVAGIPVTVGVVNRVTNRLRARAELPLAAGQYVVSDGTRRSNQASLIVEP